MRATISRRSLVVGIAGGLGLIGSGGYVWSQYSTRNHLQFRPLECVNRSSESVEPVVTVQANGEPVSEPMYDTLAPAGTGHDDTTHFNGPWIKHPQAYSIHVELNDGELHLENGEIIAQLPDSGWGRECASVTIIITETKTLNSKITPSDVC